MDGCQTEHVKLRTSVCALSILLFAVACGDRNDDAPAIYEDAINEMVCFNPGTTFEEMDAETRAYAEQQGLSAEDVARDVVLGAREVISVDGEFGRPCR